MRSFSTQNLKKISLASYAEVSRMPQPTRGEIEDGLGGVLCRCTGYQKIVEAVAACANAEEIPAAQVSLGHVGDRLPKVDGFSKLSGVETFGADGIPANARWLRVVRSPHHRAQFSLAQVMRYANSFGIVKILTAADVPSNGFGIYPHIKDQPVFAVDEVRFKGEAVCAIIGEREAIEAIDLSTLPISWTPLPPVFGIDEAARAQISVHPRKPNNILIDGVVKKEAFFAPQVLTGDAMVHVRVKSGFVEHAYIEPEAGWAERRGERLELHVTTQTPYMDRDEVAVVMKLPAAQIRIVPTACGGGFGGKLDMSVHPYIALAAWQLPDRPVACVYTRPESMASTTKRHPSDITLTMTANQDGKLQSCISHAKFDTGAYASWGPTVATRVPIHATGPYAVPHVENRGTAYFTHCHPSGAFRGFGVPQGALAHEAAMDALADELKIDRLEFRARNAIGVGDATATGQILKSSAGLLQCVEALRPRWKIWQGEVTEFNRAHATSKRGIGIGGMWYGI